MLKKDYVIAALLSVLLIAGCATTQETDSRLEQLQDQYTLVSSSENASEYAPVQLKEAEEALNKLERMLEQDAKESQVAHQVYIVERKLDVAVQTARMNKADEVVEQAGERRNELLLAARTQRAEQAEARAAEKEQQAVLAEQRAERARREALAAQALADQMSERAKALENELENISTEKTERGLVLTLGNILFEVDEATIKAGAERTLVRVAAFLKEYPERDVVIEGFTDSTGDDAYNLNLSDRRAASVKENLVANGVASERVTTKGYGEAHPVASNNTAAGRLQNRRVEIIIANEGETVESRQ
ncbi:OmpA family protein [Gilvimarinus algae]|uniref:OmpA family protein n=1 Tax=Gilvimarinus algae TaxID=3058037 RepID=A0ABT8TM76_9GAMM|nr:OmpA family protein [Gilvimarinus sp. SDUM040014]MDO3383487.1 OmpA family protein [Gilvimarinus sp. SDUM040014]